MIQLERVTKSYENFQLKDVTCTINEGEVFGVIGESGSGKSTLLKLLNLTEPFDSGELTIDGVGCRHLTNQQKNQLKQSIGTMFQEYHLLSNLTVIENIFLPLKLKGIKSRKQAEHWLNKVGLYHLRDTYPSQLSGGQKQRIALARALVTDPKIILLDEATSALDDFNANLILNILQDVQQDRKLTIVFISHDLHKVKMFCNRCLVLEKDKMYQVIDVNKQVSDGDSISYSKRAVRSLTE